MFFTLLKGRLLRVTTLKALKNVANKFSLDIGCILVKGVNEDAPLRMMNLMKEMVLIPIKQHSFLILQILTIHK